MKKRIFLVALVLALVLVLAACGSGEVKLAEVDTGLGLKLQLPENMTAADADGTGFSAIYNNNTAAVSIVREGYDDYAEMGMDISAITLEEYQELVVEANGLTESFQSAPNGQPYITYTREAEGDTFFYYTTLRKGSDAFWIVNYNCFADQQNTYLSQFESWAETIVVD